MSQIYSELIEDYFINNIKGDIFKDESDQVAEETESAQCEY